MLETSPSAPGKLERAAPYKRKLIEVALPLQAINKAAAREKSIRHGHPSTLHLWWARRPLAACRAMLFASLVDDPSSHPERFATPEDQERERKRLFDLIEQLVQWESSLNEHVLAEARKEIRKSVGHKLPTVYDPFCGGGAIPIEAQRLGLPTLASDLNPVAVLITRALTEMPWRFKGHLPVHPSLRGPLQPRTWERATGLAADVEAYGNWILGEARERIGSSYPCVRLDDGSKATVIAWIWARTVRCPNPLCGAQMPLIKSFALSTKSGKECCLEPLIDRSAKTIRYQTRAGKPDHDGTVTRRGAQCIVCNEPVALTHIRSEGKGHRIGVQMIAIVADGPRGRVYLRPDEEHVRIALSAQPAWTPNSDLPERALGFRVQAYGMTKHRDLFTQRQLLALTTFSDLVRECRERILVDAITADLHDDGVSFESGGSGATAYADAVATYLAFAVDRLADYHAALCSWHASGEKIRNVFTRQTLSMVWDFAEANPLSESTGNFAGAIEWVQKSVAAASPSATARVFQNDAASDWNVGPVLVSTDPPYYDNVPYADLSDFFYIWLRASIGERYPELLAALLVPKAHELVADPARFSGSDERARAFFEDGLRRAFDAMHNSTLAAFPTTVIYAFKQAEANSDEDNGEDRTSLASVGWEAMLNALLGSGFEIVGTWPIRSELANRTRGLNSNALASSIVLSCRPRTSGVARSTRADFLRELRAQLPRDVRRLRDASLAATDLEQAAIGPGMAVFSRYVEVLEPDGRPMTIRSALALINEELAQILLGEIAEVDPGTHFALSWFDSRAYEKGPYGEAEVLLKAKNATLEGLKAAGVMEAERGIVRLLRPQELATTDGVNVDGRLKSMPVWAKLMYTMAALNSEDGGEEAAGDVLRLIGPAIAETLKNVAYHCYVACSRLKRSIEAQDFNALVTAWPELDRLSKEDREQRLL